jgi:hypothetical protein
MSVASVGASGAANNNEESQRVINQIGTSMQQGAAAFGSGGDTGDKIGAGIVACSAFAGPYAPVVAGIGALVAAIF